MRTLTTSPDTSLVQHSTAARAWKNLASGLGNEELGIQILFVHEVVGSPEVTAVPQTPVDVERVDNRRTRVSPVIDLRGKIALEELVLRGARREIPVPARRLPGMEKKARIELRSLVR